MCLLALTLIDYDVNKMVKEHYQTKLQKIQFPYPLFFIHLIRLLNFFYTRLTNVGEGETPARSAKESLFASRRGSASLNMNGIIDDKG